MKTKIMVEKYIINESNHCGSCPECGTSWDNGEVVDYLMDPEKYLGAIDDRALAESVAKRSYGWTPENKRRISKLAYIEPSDGDGIFNGVDGFYQCPQCQIAWGTESGERTDRYKVMLDEGSAFAMLMKEFREKNKNNL